MLPKTKRQKEVLALFQSDGAISKETAVWTFGRDYKTTINLVHLGFLNTFNGHEFWVRQENEYPTIMYSVFSLYSRGNSLIVDGKYQDLVVCRYNMAQPKKNVMKAIFRLTKKLNLNQTDVMLDGLDMNYWDETSFYRFDFNGTDFHKTHKNKKRKK